MATLTEQLAELVTAEATLAEIQANGERVNIPGKITTEIDLMKVNRLRDRLRSQLLMRVGAKSLVRPYYE